MNYKNMPIMFMISALMINQLVASEYFVNKQGNDANAGLSRDKAFFNVQKGIDALQSGDSLTIGPGEYFETVKRQKLGSADKDTIIRAEMRGTVLLRGDVAAPDFAKVEGYRFVYAADFPQPVQAVNEVDTLMTMGKRLNVNELEYQPGTFYYDAVGKKLYLSSTDLQAAGKHRYTVSVIKSNGLYLEEPCRVIVDGLAFTGFNTDTAAGWGPDSTMSGLLMKKPVRCVIRHCIAFLNSAGLVMSIEGAGGSNVIESCVSYGNYSSLNGEGCNIQILGPDNDTIRDCYGYMGRDHNISMYGRVKNPDRPSWIRNCLAWGAWLDIQQKSGGTHQWMAEYCVALNTLRAQTTRHCAFGKVDGPGSPDCLALDSAMGKKNQEFADPENLDFRLQGTSRLRGQGTNGTTLGAFSYQSNIYYVAVGGNDRQDGLSLSNAWKTLEHAVKSLKSGDTLYLEPGVYTCGPITGADHITIRGRGIAPVSIKGSFEWKRCAGVSLERLNMLGLVKVSESRDIGWKNCTFAGLEADGVETLKAEHCVFIAAPELKVCTGIFLSGNIYAAALRNNGSKIAYSDYNSYPDESALKAMPDVYSQIIKPEIETRESVPVLRNGYAFGGRGPNGTALGLYHEFRKRPFPLAGPFVHSVSATTANIEWWTSQAALTEIVWGETPDCVNTQRLNTDCYNTFSLTGLQPGRQYYFKIKSMTVKPNTAFAQIMDGIDAELQPVAVKTEATVSEPKTYYVAPDGKAEYTGLSRDQAWPTIGAAANKVNAGDTVLIAGGTYKETIQMRATGDKERPITFKSLPGEKVVLDGDKRSLDHAFRMCGKGYLNFDGLYFAGHGYGSAIVMNDCHHINVRRCFFKQEGGIHATACSDMLIENCVIRGAMEAVSLQGCPNVRFEHNVSFVNLIMHGQFIGGKTFYSNNILTDNQLYKLPVVMFIMNRTESLVDSNNCYFLRIPDAQRKMFHVYSWVPPPKRYGRFSLAEYYEVAGSNGQSLLCDPQFRGLIGVNIPAYKGAASKWDGLTIDPVLLDAVADGKPGYPPDSMPQDSDFDAFFATNPEVVKRGIGLQPEAFKDFNFDKKDKTKDKQGK